ncbi:MAG: glycoside hydrolase family 16 protein [Petrimonas sp.]|nr:glycoside hydrolase family 16 protein [Petrimonas sp.]
MKTKQFLFIFIYSLFLLSCKNSPEPFDPSETPVTWVLDFQDDFEGNSINENNWGIYDNSWNQIGLRRREALKVADGKLNVMVIRRPDGSYMTGGLAHRKEYKYGKFEFRINAGKDPLNATSAIALTWPDSENWPQDGENDIYETLFKRNSFETFIHYAVDGQDQKHQKTHLIDPTQWHIVAMEWMPEYIKIYCDNNLEWTLKDTKAIPDVFHHICFQIEVDETKEITDTIAMQVDWVKVYKPVLAGK